MQLVVMAAVVLALVGPGAGTEQSCSPGCHLISISTPVDVCGSTQFVQTTKCEGQCHQEDPVYIGTDFWPTQKVCNGDWNYEVKYFKGCSVAVSYPVARSCECTTCNPEDTDCGRFPGHLPVCLPA
uniref:Follitropin subunit beta n=1 Tax=Girella punctata TaxID=163149 RepID=A0AAF0Z3S4_GIRPU|nr:follitropin subunit beta [Girella punctata]